MLFDFGLLVAGLVVLTFGADALVRGSSGIAARLGISPLVVGLTVVAFGTSAPEMAISTMSVFEGKVDLAVGNVIGSNIFNILVILGLSAIIAPLSVDRKLVRVEVPLLIAASFAVVALCWDKELTQYEGMALLSVLIGYTFFLLKNSRDGDVEGADDIEDAKKKSNAFLISITIAGFVGLVLGSRLIVDGASGIARAMGLSELIIGLTIVSMGTSIPEVAASVVATIKGQRDIAVGNAIGSCLFNLFAVLGIATVLPWTSIPVAPTAFAVDMPFMIATAVACLPVFVADYTINRWHGATFLAFYVGYIVFLILAATNSGITATYKSVFFGFIGPLVSVTIIFLAAHGIRKRRKENQVNAT